MEIENIINDFLDQAKTTNSIEELDECKQNAKDKLSEIEIKDDEFLNEIIIGYIDNY